MKKAANWFKQKMAIASIAISNVEKNALSQNNEGLGTDANQTMRINQGKISDSLINGEITQEVMDLRWRMYKVMETTDTVKVKLNGYDLNGKPIYDITSKSHKIKKANLDKFDPYEAELIVDNTPIEKSIIDGLEAEKIIEIDTDEVKANDDNMGVVTTLAEIDGGNYFAQASNDRPVTIKRNILPTFYLENFTKTLKIRKIDETKRLLEFYVSLYPDEYDRKSRLFISTVKKQIENPILTNSMLELDEVSFITDKTQGAPNNYRYEYNNLVFDKIVTHNGHYVIKFIADVKTNGEYIMEEYRQTDLDNKYINKEKK